jgi:hypothetical protein
MLSTHLDKIEEYKLNYLYDSNIENYSLKSRSDLNSEFSNKNNNSNKSKKLYTVICKCICFENLIKKSSENFDEENNSYTDLIKACTDFAGKKSLNQDSIDKCILEIPSKNKEKSIFITKNKSVFIFEYLLEYNYSFNNINLNSVSKSENKFTRNIKQNNIYNSSYISKEINSFLLKEEYIQIFNNSLCNLINSEIKKYIPDEILENYSSCKFQFLDEMNTSELFFSKNTILNFLHTSHKYPNAESFNEDFNRIVEKLDEIKNLNFKNPIVIINFNKNNLTPQKSKDINLLKNSISNNFNKDSKSDLKSGIGIDRNQNNELGNISINTNQLNKSQSITNKDNQVLDGKISYKYLALFF